MECILGTEYTPTIQDVLQSCVITTGILEYLFKVGQIKYMGIM